MTQAETLLASVAETVSDHEHTVTDSDSYFVIDPVSRAITNDGYRKVTLMQYDHNSSQLTFELSRYVDGHDMSLCNRVRVHYINIEITDDNQVGETYSDLAELTDLRVNPENPDTVICSWTITRRSTQFAGTLNFLVQYMCVSDMGVVDYEFHSDIYESIEINDGLNNGEAAIIEHTDLIEQWRAQLFGAGNSAVAEITLNAETQLKNVENEGAEQVAAVKAEGEAQIEAIEKLGDESISAIESKGVETLATIPDDYTVTYNTAQNALRTRANAIVGNVEGETITTNDCSSDYLRGLRIFGKSTQVTTTGKNLLEVTQTGGTVSTATVSVNEDGSFVINGTVDINSAFIVGKFRHEGDFILSMTSVGNINGSYVYLDMAPADNIGWYGKDVALSNDGTERTLLAVIIAGTYSNVTFYPMIRYASVTDGSYEPYTGGMPSPDPDYPQEINSVENAVVKVCGKNLLNLAQTIEKAETGYNYDLFTGTAGVASPIPVEKLSLLPRIEAGRTYYLSYDISNFDGEPALRIIPVNDDGSILTTNGSVGAIFENKGAFTPDISCLVTIRVGNASALTISNIQLEIGTEKTDYEPYTEQAITLNRTLPGIAVPTNGNYTDSNDQQWICDEIDFERGVYIQRIGRISLDDSVTYFYNTDNYFLHTGAGLFDNVAAWETRILSTHFVPVGNGIDMYDYGWFQFDGNGGVRFRIEGIDTVDALSTWLTSNSPEIIYPFDTPIETPLTDEELFAFSQLHSNYPNTTILNTENAYMSVAYNADTKTYLDNLIKDILSKQ